MFPDQAMCAAALCLVVLDPIRLKQDRPGSTAWSRRWRRSEPKRSRNRSFRRFAFMAHNTQETGIGSGLDKVAADTVLRRESDRDVRRRELYADELRRHVGAVEGNRHNVRVALTELYPTQSEPIARLSLPTPPTLAETVGSALSTSSTPPFARGGETFETGSSLATRRPISQPSPSLANGELGGAQSPPRPAVLATLIGPTKPDAGRSIPTDDVLGRYARSLPLTGPASWYTGPRNGMEQTSDRIDPQAKTPVPRMVQQDAATELTMSQALALDRTLGERAIGAAWSGFSEAVGPGDRRPRASDAQTMIEPNRGAPGPGGPTAQGWGVPARRFSPLADTSTTGLGKEAMAAVTEELERLRSAARQTADELEKVRGPVPPAFPSRPPVFRDRS
jgi:hypothetical protein